MQSFVVSARKYRPLSWVEVVGQDHIVTTLKNAINSNHLAQSFLFCGPRGVGKTTCARILAKTINCENLSDDGDACETCVSCKSFAENASFNIHEIDAASNNSVDDIRNLVDQVRYAPQSGKYKVYIIDEVHMLSSSAFNAFLKTLEEPPAYVKFILATTEKYKIIPTILSRCQIFDFNRITIRDMIKQLNHISAKEGVAAEEDALHIIAQKADGAMRDALSIFDRITTFSGKSVTAKDVIENLNILDYDYYFRITDLLLQQDAAPVLLLFNEISSKGFDGDTFLLGLAEHMRNLLVCMDPSTIKLLETSENVALRYKEQATQITPSFALSALNLLNQADIQYRVARNKHLHVELALMRLCHISSAIITPGISSAEKKKPELNIPDPIPLKVSTHKKAATEKEKEKESTKSPSEEPKKVVVKNTVPPPVVTPLIPRLDFQLNKREEKTGDKEEVEFEDKSKRKPIAPELFFMAWKKYADHIRSEKQHMAVLMDHSRVHIGEQNVVEVRVESQMEATLMKDSSQDLRSFLSNIMESHAFDLVFSVVEKEEKTRRPYTVKEKYKKMEEVNPSIRDLTDKLGFELDV